MVAIRFLERSALDTLARLVDPRGGYILLSTFIEEEREVLASTSGGGDSMRRRSSGAAGTRGVVFYPRGSKASTQARAGDTADGNGGGGGGGGSAGVGADSLVRSVRGCKGDVDGHESSNNNATMGGGAAYASTAGTAAADTTATPTARASGGLEQAEGQSVDGNKHTGQFSRLRVSTGKSNGKSHRGGGARVVDAGKKTKKRGSAAAILEAAVAAATMARWPHDSPKDPKKILRRGELARHFGDRHGFEVLEDSVERLPDGRPVACFLARRVRK